MYDVHVYLLNRVRAEERDYDLWRWEVRSSDHKLLRVGCSPSEQEAYTVSLTNVMKVA